VTIIGRPGEILKIIARAIILEIIAKAIILEIEARAIILLYVKW
jgi:hypothetical protein